MEARFCTVLTHNRKLYEALPDGKKKEYILFGKPKAEGLMHLSGKMGLKDEIYWYEDHCLVRSEKIQQEYGYEGLRGLKEEGDYWLVLFGGGTIVAVDKKGFRQGRPEKFPDFIKGKM